MRKLSSVGLGILGIVASAIPAMAYTVDISSNDVVNGAPVPAVGATFVVTGGTFSNYIQGPGDPTVSGDLPNFRYDLNGITSSVDFSTGIIDYAGTYEIYYLIQTNEISAGTFSLEAQFAAGTNNAALTGLLTQTAGPSNPVLFADLSEGGHTVSFVGNYTGGVTTPLVGSLSGTLSLNAGSPVPTPAAASAGLGLLSLLGFRRSRRTNA